MKKKLLSWLLVAALVITMIPGSAFAAPEYGGQILEIFEAKIPYKNISTEGQSREGWRVYKEGDKFIIELNNRKASGGITGPSTLENKLHFNGGTWEIRLIGENEVGKVPQLGGANSSSIYITAGTKVTITGQGSLAVNNTVTGAAYSDAIGIVNNSSLTIDNGTVNATGRNGGIHIEPDSNLIVNNGAKVTAKTTYDDSTTTWGAIDNAGIVTINGGTVKLEGSSAQDYTYGYLGQKTCKLYITGGNVSSDSVMFGFIKNGMEEITGRTLDVTGKMIVKNHFQIDGGKVNCNILSDEGDKAAI